MTKFSIAFIVLVKLAHEPDCVIGRNLMQAFAFEESLELVALGKLDEFDAARFVEVDKEAAKECLPFLVQPFRFAQRTMHGLPCHAELDWAHTNSRLYLEASHLKPHNVKDSIRSTPRARAE